MSAATTAFIAGNVPIILGPIMKMVFGHFAVHLTWIAFSIIKGLYSALVFATSKMQYIWNSVQSKVVNCCAY